MESVITLAGAYEGGHGVGKLYQPEGMARSGGAGFLRPIGGNDSMSISSEFSSSNRQEPYEFLWGSLKSFPRLRIFKSKDRNLPHLPDFEEWSPFFPEGL